MVLSFMPQLIQLQRMGRTGRKREGRVVFLLTEGKEERDHLKSQDAYEKIQKKIALGNEFEFDLDKSPRILPKEFQPDCVKMVITPPNETLDDLELKIDRRKKVPKKQKVWTLPENVETGFVRASALSKRKQVSDAIDDSVAFVDPESLASPFLSKEEEDRVRRHRVHVSPTPRRKEIFDTRSSGSIPAGSLRNRLARTREAMKDPKRASRTCGEDDIHELTSTPPGLFANDKPREKRISERNPNIPPRSNNGGMIRVESESPKGPFDLWDDNLSSADSLPDLSAELLFAKDGSTKSEVKDSDDEYKLPSEFEITPRKRIRIAELSDEEGGMN